METLLVICQGIGLAAACGVRPFLPALLAGALAGAVYLFLVGRVVDRPPGKVRWLLPLLLTAIWLIPVPPTQPESGRPDDGTS
jgi:hypothetical protein